MNAPPAVENHASLIQKIRQEGVERAQREADALVAAAKQQAADIVQAAEQRAAQLIGEAEERGRVNCLRCGGRTHHEGSSSIKPTQFGAMRGALGLLPVVVPLFVVFLLLGWINRSAPHPTAR